MANVREVVANWAAAVENDDALMLEFLAGFGGSQLALDVISNITERNAKVQLLFKRTGTFSFGGFAHNADIEGNAGTTAASRDIPAHSEGELNDGSYKPINDNANGDFMVIPVNPQNITVNASVNTQSYETSLHAELAVMSGLKLRTFSIDSFFPAYPNEFQNLGTGTVFKPVQYVNWILSCMQAKSVLHFYPFGNADVLPEMDCFISSFSYTLEPNGDVSYSLEITEFIDYRKRITERQIKLTPNEVKIVTPTAPKRDIANDDIIVCGDYIVIKDGYSVYNDQFAQNPMTLGQIIGSPLQYSPEISLQQFLTFKKGEDGDTEWDTDTMKGTFVNYGTSQYSSMVMQYGTGLFSTAYYTGLTTNLIKFLIDMESKVKQQSVLGYDDIWQVINYYHPRFGAGYKEKANATMVEDLKSLRFTWLTTLMKDFRSIGVKDMWMLELQVRSMSTGKTGWIKREAARKINNAMLMRLKVRKQHLNATIGIVSEDKKDLYKTLGMQLEPM